MLKVVFLQMCATLVAAALAAVFFGVHGAVSATLAGLVCAVPNLLFALRMKAISKHPGPVTAMTFMIGEFIKIVAIVGLLVLIQALYEDLHWGGLFIGLILALKANLFAFLVKT